MTRYDLLNFLQHFKFVWIAVEMHQHLTLRTLDYTLQGLNRSKYWRLNECEVSSVMWENVQIPDLADHYSIYWMSDWQINSLWKFNWTFSYSHSVAQWKNKTKWCLGLSLGSGALTATSSQSTKRPSYQMTGSHPWSRLRTISGLSRWAGQREVEWLFLALTFQIKYVSAKDAGSYECQVSTVPKMSQKVELVVVVPKVSFHLTVNY